MHTPPPETRLSLQQRLQNRIDDFRHQLAYTDALPQLCLLGLLSGTAAALLIVCFRLAIEFPLNWFLINGSDNFESLPPAWRFFLASGGGLLIGLLLQFVKPEARQLSVSHVIDRLHHHQGRLPFSNMLVQFAGGVLCLLTGQSVGREGPAVHLGGAAASQMGQWLKLPHNSLRTLVGCGVAAAIAASFNTPIAGVIFAMEVVLMEYSIIGFLPVILASVSGAAITQLVFGPEPAFNVPPIQMNSLLELPFMVVAGLLVAVIAALFSRLQLFFQRFQHWPILVRATLAGVVTGTLALWIPQVMGIGYDTVNATLAGELSVAFLAVIILAKLIATSISTGLGQPGGLIGPIFMLGACLGGLMGIASNAIYPGSTPNFYVMVCMGGLVAAVLNAPLAALMAVLELTYNPNIIFPSMLVIVVACVTTRHLFRCEGIFLAQLDKSNKPLQRAPLRQTLERAAVRSVMDTHFSLAPYQLDYAEAHALLTSQPRWIVSEELGRSTFLLPAATLADYLQNPPEAILAGEESIDLRKIPGTRWRLQPINQQASLYDAYLQLTKEGAEALYVQRISSPLQSPVIGIITPDALDHYYQL